MLGRLAHLNLTTCALVTLALSTLYALLQFSPTPYKHNRCLAVQQTGWWTDKTTLLWQPEGCTLKQYAPKDTGSCLNKDFVVFIGDSSVRDKFYAFVRLVDPKFGNQGKIHADIRVNWPGSEDLAAYFVWDPYLKSETTWKVVGGETTQTLARPPRSIVVGAGSWFLRNKAESGGLTTWRKSVDQLAAKIAARKGSALPRVFVSPVPNVVPEKLAAERRQALDPNAIYWMNKYMERIGLEVFSAWSRMTAGAPETSDGLHYSPRLEDRAIGLLMNNLCNSRLPRTPPFRTTCCFEYPSPNMFPKALALGVVAMGLLMWAKRSSETGWRQAVPSFETLRQMAVFSAILLLMYVNDRTPLFGKIQKNFVGWVFGLLTAVALAAGGFTVREDLAPGFLNRDQTDEWKGWMQLAILIYHVMNASTVSGIYNPVRVLVAMYLFMTGYGHFFYFYKKKNYGLARLTVVLLRTNILAVVLAYVMGTSYMDYYFAPLSSIWVLIVWLTMRILPEHNYTNYVWAKIAVSAALFSAINSLHLWPMGLLSVVNVNWSAHEWEFRFGVDRFIVYVGMIAALITIRYKDALTAHARWAQIKRWTVLFSIIGMVWYFWFELTSESKFTYNAYHPYVSPVPVVTFVILRNSTQFLRSHSSQVFRSVGQVSLELFIAQFHLWLAADTKGILVLVDGRLWLINLFFSSVVFLALCQHLSHATGTLTSWLMHKPAAAATSTDIPLTEIGQPSEQHVQRAQLLDRLAGSGGGGNPKVNWRESLAVRWIAGLALLILLNILSA